MKVAPSGSAADLEVLCPDEAATREVGRDLGRRCVGGGLVLLKGPLGCGKTVFVRGLAEGLGIDPSEVSSPTFALVHEYGPPGRPAILVHADLYRLSGGPREDLDVSELQLDRFGEEGAVLAVEWPGHHFDGDDAWSVELETEPDGVRRIRVRTQRAPLRSKEAGSDS